MEIGHIAGATRALGRSQGYIGLPVRDILVNDSVTGPDSPAMETAWFPTLEEIVKIAAGAPVILRVSGNVHPPVMIDVGDAPTSLAMPTNADEAAAMQQLGHAWLQANAPERLTSAGRVALVEPPGVLCYVAHDRAWFTTAPLNKQWGDDWGDAPYEHNAGSPYTHNHETVTAVPFDPGRLQTPAQLSMGSSNLSVETINAHTVPWLKSESDGVYLWAGVTFAQFRAAVTVAGGTVFAPWPEIGKEPS